MPRVILIYANCTNPTARGDFTFAGDIARELSVEIKKQQQDIEVILVSTLDGIDRYKSLYPPVKNHPGQHFVGSEIIPVCALENLDTVKNTVIAMIEANPCKTAASDIIKRVLSPKSKFLFIGNANQSSFAELHSRFYYLMHVKNELPCINQYIDDTDILTDSAGIGNDRMGIATIADVNTLSVDRKSSKVPQQDYGFMYINAIHPYRDQQIISQYIKLSDMDRYVLVGNCGYQKTAIEQCYFTDTSFPITKKNFPRIDFHQSLDHADMRQVSAYSTSSLVLSTGVMSTLEVMHDRKLPFYQDLPNNINFMASYLIAVKTLVSNDGTLTGSMPQLIIDLSELLFAHKPLSTQQMTKLSNRLSISSVQSRLIDTNQTIIKQAQGKIAPKILQFLNQSHNSSSVQLTHVCLSLRKPSEKTIPITDKALRRAAFWGRTFELKVLINACKSFLNKTDPNYKRTALHWAVRGAHLDSVRLLVQAGADQLVKDLSGKTALEYAIDSNNTSLIQALNPQQIDKSYTS